MTIIYEKGGICMQDVDPAAFTIYSITLYDTQHRNGYKEAYGTSEEGQKSAWEVLEQICAEENVTASLCNTKPRENTVSSLIGPKRLEITLRTIGGVGPEKKLVVTDLMPPAGHYKYYSVAGRLWEDYHKKLKGTTETFWGSTYWLARIDAFLGGSAGSATDHFTPQNEEQAWASLEKMWYKFQPAEITVIKNWTVAETGTTAAVDDDIYGEAWYGPARNSQHWTQRTPSAYDTKPIVAHFRVAGDEVGAVIYREQQEAWTQEHGDKTPAETLAELLAPPAEKKDEVGAQQASGSDSDTPATVSVCDECGGPACTPAFCVEDLDLAAFGGRVVVDGRYTIH